MGSSFPCAAHPALGGLGVVSSRAAAAHAAPGKVRVDSLLPMAAHPASAASLTDIPFQVMQRRGLSGFVAILCLAAQFLVGISPPIRAAFCLLCRCDDAPAACCTHCEDRPLAGPGSHCLLGPACEDSLCGCISVRIPHDTQRAGEARRPIDPLRFAAFTPGALTALAPVSALLFPARPSLHDPGPPRSLAAGLRSVRILI